MIRSTIASHFKRAKTMGFLWTLLAFALHVWPGAVDPAHAQGTRKDDIVFNSRGIPLAGATVRVCAMPASGQPCTPLALLYSDAALTQAIANPTTTDGLGNYFFYAAPGKYEIEISGPGITTKQLPNVILPNDPASPTFTGAVSAFSLTLSGNLSVTGNTTVIGSLASGTLNLTNQGSAPGTPGSGTINLYTKNSDKHLYYKDDTGLETGPLGLGAQTNSPNTFTAAQNFDADVENKGPNPNFSLARYGGYSSTSSTPPSTTGSISSGSSTLTLAAAQDFANGQGIVVYQAGASAASQSLTTPGTPTVTPVYLSGGSTTYAYKVVAEARNGALTAASGAGSTTTGAATLGVNTVTLTTCARTNNVTTYTSSSTHNIVAGAQIDIEGFGGNDLCNGVKTVLTTPTGTTFTVSDGIAANTNNTSGSPTAKVVACNTLTFASGSYSGASTLRYWIYRNNALAGVAQGQDPWFMDCGAPAPNAPAYVPSSPPSSTQNGYLATTISAGGGTTTLTLATAASNTVSSQTVLHDNAMPLKNAVQVALNASGGEVYIPNAISNYWVFNSTMDLTSGLSNLCCAVRIHSNSSFLWLNQPWILHGNFDLEGEPRSGQTFQYVNNSPILGIAYPLILITEGSGAPMHIKQVQLACNQAGQSCIFADEGPDGGGATGVVLEDVSVAGTPTSKPIVWKGGFDFYWKRGSGQNLENSFSGGYILTLTNSSQAVTGSTTGQVPGRVYVQDVDIAGGSFELNCLPNNNSPGGNDYTFGPSIDESVVTPFFHLNCPGGGFQNFNFPDVQQADDISGNGTPLVDGANGGIGSVTITGGSAFASTSPAFIAGNSGILLGTNQGFTNPGNVTYLLLNGGGAVTNGLVNATGTSGSVQYAMQSTPAPGVAVSAGGSVPVGTIPYTVQFLDVNGNAGPVSPAAIATTTTGNQTVTITIPTPPAGAVSWFPYRNNARLNVVCNTPFPVSTTTFVDSFAFGCGQSSSPASGGTTIFGATGISTPQLREVANGFVISHAAPSLTANRTYSNPDVSGYVPVTGYLNNAYDNATRANGAIGANWTQQNNTINISSNQFVGTGAANNAYFWNVNPFSPAQFSEVTVTAYNGTTDFYGPSVLMSGSGSGAHSYNCLADTTTIFLQRTSGTTNTNLTSAAITGTAGDVIRLESDGAGNLTCYQNGVAKVTQNDTTYTTGQPGLLLSGSVATAKNWQGGNLHPLAHLDAEQNWTKPQHWNGGIPQDAQSFKHQTVTTGSIGAGACSNVTLTWTSPFLDTNYQAWPSVLDSTSAAKGLTIDHVQAQTASSAVVVVCNGSAGALTGTLQVLAVHN